MPTRLPVAFRALGVALFACSKMDPQECTKLRDKSFELINQASVCTQDADCKPSEWPGCAKPVSSDSFGKIHAMMDSFKKGKCDEKTRGMQTASCGFLPGGPLRVPLQALRAAGRRNEDRIVFRARAEQLDC